LRLALALSALAIALIANAVADATGTDPLLARLGLPPIKPGSPLPGYLMIADRENNRIIVVGPTKQIVWRFPAPHGPGAGNTFLGPDDAFISPDQQYVSTNQEFSETVAIISLSRTPRIVWHYGHQGEPGSGSGYLAHPDDAYLLPNGLLSIADIINCRVIWLDRAKRISRTLGTAGDCEHKPPRALSSPNGDTPLPDGGVLVTEIGGWVDRFDRGGRLLWSIKTPTDYPSDAQLLPEGNVLVAAYNTPGRIDIIDPRTRRSLWTYGPTSGPGSLDRPSLAVALPSGNIAATDDWDQRVVVIDRATKRIIWQYGHDHIAGSSPGYLNKPDGLDLLP
jgi:DNA-binding beta-propeller fold protein YncE